MTHRTRLRVPRVHVHLDILSLLASKSARRQREEKTHADDVVGACGAVEVRDTHRCHLTAVRLALVERRKEGVVKEFRYNTIRYDECDCNHRISVKMEILAENEAHNCPGSNTAAIFSITMRYHGRRTSVASTIAAMEVSKPDPMVNVTSLSTNRSVPRKPVRRRTRPMQMNAAMQTSETAPTTSVAVICHLNSAVSTTDH